MQIAQTPQERIRQRRTQMLIHSYVYYQLGDSIVSDHDWQRWADELVTLQRDHPGAIGFYDAEFAGWDGSTGFHLPQDTWVSEKATHIRILNSALLLKKQGWAPPPPRPAVVPPSPPRAAPAVLQYQLF